MMSQQFNEMCKPPEQVADGRQLQLSSSPIAIERNKEM